MTSNNTLAARFFFRNCCVSLYSPGDMKISHDITPKSNDIVFDRDFYSAKFPSEFLDLQSDFYRFLVGISSTNASMINKMLAIGYLLCNKLPKHNPTRMRSFICVNEYENTIGNGKSLFCKAIAQYCNTIKIDGRDYCDPFAFCEVSENTQLVLLEDFPKRGRISNLFEKCTNDWIINRKGRYPFVIEHAKSPHILITSNLPMTKVRKDSGFLRRFTVLEFSSFFGPENSIIDSLGHNMFLNWDIAQWHMFDNLMFFCVRQYLLIRPFSNNSQPDIFR